MTRHFVLLSGLIKTLLLSTATAIGDSGIAQRIKTGQETGGPRIFSNQ